MTDHRRDQPLARHPFLRRGRREGARKALRPGLVAIAELPADQVERAARLLAIRVEEDPAVEMIGYGPRIILVRSHGALWHESAGKPSKPPTTRERKNDG